MSNNTFNGKRFLLLWKQHFIHNTRLLILSSVAYLGVIFIVLSIGQIGNGMVPHDSDSFQTFSIGFFIVFGVLYAGHAFPALRAKESTINYIMAPASTLEKFLFEFLSRVGIVILTLPFLFWLAFHLQGYFFSVLTYNVFEPIGLGRLFSQGIFPASYDNAMITLVIVGTLLILVIPLTGATIFRKQPLVKTLVSLVLIFLFYFGYAYTVLQHGGLGRYNISEDMWLIPWKDQVALWWLNSALIVTCLVMLFVGYRRLKEKEV